MRWGDTSPGCRKLQEGIVVTTVLICDDRRSVREGLTRVMSAVPGVHRIDCVAHGDELLARFSRQPVDVVLVGTQRAVPTGVEATRRLVAAHPQANVIVFGAPDDAGSIAAAIAGGARGYLRWDASRPELVAALAHTLASTAVPTPRTPTDPGVQLTERELQVLRGMSQGKSNGQIGRELYLSEDTVKTHARRLFRKLGVRDRAQAVAHGFRRGPGLLGGSDSSRAGRSSAGVVVYGAVRRRPSGRSGRPRVRSRTARVRLVTYGDPHGVQVRGCAGRRRSSRS